MADTEAPAAAPSAAATPKKSAAQKKAKNPRTKPSHPPTSEMVNTAIKSLKERGGSSLQAIKKHISANYKVDTEKLSPFIKKYLKTAVQAGGLVQTKGKGASGSFKLSTGGGSEAPYKPKASKRSRSSSARPAKAAAKKPAVAKPKKAVAAKKAVVSPKAKKAVAAKKPASPKAAAPKAKKSAKRTPTKKPKAPKPKKAKPAKSAKKSPKK